MANLSLYAAISRFGALNYRAKIMVVAFLGTHLPLLAIIGFYLFRTTADMGIIWSTLAVALIATLVGTGITLFVLNQLLQPVLLTSQALRRYAEDRQIEALPTQFTDEAGTLMADASRTLTTLEASLKALENTDLVTGLPNRRQFLEILQAGLENHEPLAVTVIHVPNLPRLAATYDQTAADDFARVLAGRLGQQMGRASALARVDNAMFAALVPVTGTSDATELADTIQSALAIVGGDVIVDSVAVKPELGVGIALAGSDGETAAALLANAVAASSACSLASPVNFHSPVARDAARKNFELEQELRHAIKEQQFTLAFQPVVDTALGRTVGAEALVRWQHPERGTIAPGLFIPTAERTGLIDQIGEYVLREACHQVGRWNDEGIDDLKVAINVSARQFLDPRLIGLLSEAITDARIDPRRLEVELTESAAMVDYDHTRRAFDQLGNMGVSVAIDDFGTGYASMSYLRKLPFDKLKIDREFISHIETLPQSQAIVDALLALSKGLGLRVLSEGVERPEEVAYLQAAGCELFQGYYFSRPVAPTAMSETLADIAMMIAARETDLLLPNRPARSA